MMMGNQPQQDNPNEKLGEDPFVINDPEFVKKLRESRDVDAVWRAYGADTIDKETALSLDEEVRPKPTSTQLWVQAIGEAFDFMRGKRSR